MVKQSVKNNHLCANTNDYLRIPSDPLYSVLYVFEFGSIFNHWIMRGFREMGRFSRNSMNDSIRTKIPEEAK